MEYFVGFAWVSSSLTHKCRIKQKVFPIACSFLVNAKLASLFENNIKSVFLSSYTIEVAFRAKLYFTTYWVLNCKVR